MALGPDNQDKTEYAPGEIAVFEEQPLGESFNESKSSNLDEGLHEQIPSPPSSKDIERVAAIVGRIGEIQGIGEFIDIFSDETLSEKEKWSRIAVESRKLGPLPAKLFQTFLPFARQAPVEAGGEIMGAFSDVYSNWGPLEPEQMNEYVEIMKSEAPDLTINLDQGAVQGASIAAVYDVIDEGDPTKKYIAKLQRPDAKTKYDESFELITELMDIGSDTSEENKKMMTFLLDLAKQAYNSEFNFNQEATNLDRLRRIGIRTPRLGQKYMELLEHGILVEEKIEGHNLFEVQGRILQEERNSVALKFASDMVRMFRKGVVHGDPHPGNIMLDEDGNIVFIDPSPLMNFGFGDLWRTFRSGRLLQSGARQNNSMKIIKGLEMISEVEFTRQERRDLAQEITNKGLDGIGLSFFLMKDKGLVPRKDNFMLLRAVLETVGTVDFLTNESKTNKLSFWMRAFVRSFGSRRYR